MRVAHTELRDLLNKVFEGMGFPLGDYEDCADDVAWMALHGWPILAELLNTDPLPPSTAAHFLYEDEAVAVIDAQNNGGLIYGSLALDLAALKAQNQSIAMVRLTNACQCQLIIPSLRRRAAHGFHILAAWQEEDLRFLVSMAAHEEYPTVSFSPAKPGTPDSRLTILCSGEVPFDVPDPSLAGRIITPGDFQDAYDLHIEQGIPVEDTHWEQLIVLSKAVLVEATEESRQKGAGEDA